MALSKNTPLVQELGKVNELPVKAAVRIYEGAAVGIDVASGYCRPLVAGDQFVGFAETEANNASGSNGDIRARVIESGAVQMAVGSLAITDIGKPVYASDDGTYTLTAGSNSQIGRVKRFVSTGIGVVAYDAAGGGSGATITALTDSTGETPDSTIADVSTVVTGVDGAGSNAASKADVDTRLNSINENFSDLAAKVNAIIAILK